MELQFGKQDLTCLQETLCQVQNLEQTQELRVPEGMPGIGRVLGCWGQVLIRSKNWQRECMRLTGGTMVWVLYTPEEGTAPQRLETWIPFQMDWELPGNTKEGPIQVSPRLRFADARSVSAGKILIRVGLGVLAQCWAPETLEVWKPESVPSDVELLRESLPVRLPREAGEKPFELAEQLTVPPSVPRPKSLLYFRLEPGLTDQKVLANKVVFRGNGNLHVLYACEDGGVQSWDFELPFSQYAELECSHSPDAQAAVTMAVTALELEADPEGVLHLKAGLTGQYLVDDRQTVEIVGDAWSPLRQVTPHMRELDIPALLDSRRERIHAEESISSEADLVADALVLPDFPRQRREGDQVLLDQPAMVQLLTQDRDGKLRGTAQRMEGTCSLKADEKARLLPIPLEETVQTALTGEGVTLHLEQAVQIQTVAGQGIPQVFSLELGEIQEPDPGRPSLILRRAGTDSLWDIGRSSGSTVAAIMEANGLTGQPDPEMLLLIPVL